MVDQVNSSLGVSVQASQQVVAPHSGPKNVAGNNSNITHASTVKVEEPEQEAITEVADRAASGRRESLDSLNQIASDLREAISTLNTALEKSPTKAIITRDEDLNRFVVRIADQASGEVVREIPSEALLKFARNLQELKGLIFDASL